MIMKNLMEDVVIDIMEILLKERQNICKCQRCKLDILAFSLNRLPPKYVISERGFTHSYIEELQNYNFENDVISVVNLGIDIISKRKREEHRNIADDERLDVTNWYVKDGNYYYNFPHIIGEIFDDNMNHLINTQIVLYRNEETCIQTDQSWKNPYITKESTGGYYSFWPKWIKIPKEEQMISKSFNFKLLFKHEDFYSATREFAIVINPEETVYKYVRRNYTEKFEDVILEKRRR